MKKNYFEPVIKVQTIVLKTNMLDGSIGFDSGSTEDDAPAKDHLLDDWSL